MVSTSKSRVGATRQGRQKVWHFCTTIQEEIWRVRYWSIPEESPREHDLGIFIYDMEWVGNRGVERDDFCWHCVCKITLRSF